MEEVFCNRLVIVVCIICVQLSDSEPAVDERRDRFVAQLYKFMDDRDTPINRAPTFANSDLDLFHLFRLVASMGGYNRVSNLFCNQVVIMRC